MQNAVLSTDDQAGFPLDGFQLSRLAQAVEGLNAKQLIWASGYLAGLGGEAQHPQLVPQTPEMTILYASQGGNARRVAEVLATDARQRGLASRLVSVEQYKPRELAREKLLIVVISTQGEGEPPENALELFRHLNARRPPDLTGLRYAIFGLGDSSYEKFCEAGKDLDERLRSLGASLLAQRVDADVDFEAHTAEWNAHILKLAEESLPSDQARVIPLQRNVTSAPRHDRDQPLRAQLIERRRITTDDAVSGIYHVVLEADSSRLNYRPGDALGVLHRNDPALVEQILTLTGLRGDAPVAVRDQSVSLFDALSSRLEVTQLHPAVVAGWADFSSNPQLRALVGNVDALRGYGSDRQLIDLLHEFPAQVDAGQLVALLRPLQPRLYSIASSQSVYADEVHLTVSTLEYQAHGRDHLGSASGWLTRRLDEGADARVYIAGNPRFRLPEDGDTPIIMVGAGTGIAPYRGFLQEREALGHSGHNWLVFGNRHFHRDFLYQKDWIDFRNAGLLARTSLAFSRDSVQHPYVQDRLVEEGSEIYRWLNDGARLYVCGGLAMEKAVGRSLQTVIQTHGGLDADAAAHYIEDLRAQGRYLKDVY